MDNVLLFQTSVQTIPKNGFKFVLLRSVSNFIMFLIFLFLSFERNWFLILIVFLSQFIYQNNSVITNSYSQLFCCFSADYTVSFTISHFGSGSRRKDLYAGLTADVKDEHGRVLPSDWENPKRCVPWFFFCVQLYAADDVL